MGESSLPIGRAEWALVVLAVLAALVLGFANLGAPSLWHDELVQVFVAKQTLETGVPQQLSGRFYPSGLAYSYLLAGFIGLFGDGEAAVRAPSVHAAGLNVLLTFLLLRPLLGRAPAVLACWCLAVFPWSVAWSREARFYALHQTSYLAVLLFAWHALTAERRGKAVRNGMYSLAAYAAGVLTALHSTLFTVTVGVNGAIRALAERRVRSRGAAVFAIAVLAGAVTTGVYLASLPQADYDAIFKEGGIGGNTADRSIDPQRSERAFYFIFLAFNLSVGYLLLAALGFVLMVGKEGRRGLYVALAFWIPLFALTFLIGYRRYRFMYFAYPLYVAAHAYAMCWLAGFVWRARGNVVRSLVSILIVAFGFRVGVSTIKLVASSVDAASGADVTLARRHPQWRDPCHYVRDRLGPQDAVLSTTYLPALYYVGRCDDWFPSRMLPWEHIDSGSEGLLDVEALQGFMEEHPTGYFLAERRRFKDVRKLQQDWLWVETNLRRVFAASNEDITVYAWGV
jgi:4-amino-4-deoxy-L-arabinose transferase-like glycosyltransferase